MTINSRAGEKEKHFAIVTRVFGDPRLGRGRVFFSSETLTGGPEYSEPAEPSFDHAGANGEGLFWVPQIGDQIEVEIDKANEHSVPRIVRAIYSSADDVASEFKEEYPFRKGWRTRLGHILLFGDNPFNPILWLKHASGTGIEVDATGSEKRTVTKDLAENVLGKTTRTSVGQVAETYLAEVDKTYAQKVSFKVVKDWVLTVLGNVSKMVNGTLSYNVSGAQLKMGNGKVYLGNLTGDVIARNYEDLNAIITNQSNIVFTTVGPGQLNPAVLTVLQESLAIIGSIKQ